MCSSIRAPGLSRTTPAPGEGYVYGWRNWKGMSEGGDVR